MAQANSRSADLRPREQFWLNHLWTARQQGQPSSAATRLLGSKSSASASPRVLSNPQCRSAVLPASPHAGVMARLSPRRDSPGWIAEHRLESPSPFAATCAAYQAVEGRYDAIMYFRAPLCGR